MLEVRTFGIGGARPGSGRKKLGDKKRAVSMSIRVTLEQRDRLRKAAADAGKSITQYILDCTIGG